MRIVIIAAVMAIMGLLCVSLIGKIRNAAAFAQLTEAVAAMRVVPPRWGRPAAVAAVSTEFFVLVTLLPWPLVGLAAATLQFAGFTAFLAVAVRRGAAVGCHCFGASRTPVARRHVVRSGLLGAAAAVALGGVLSSSTNALPAVSAPQALVAAAAAAGFGSAMVWLDDLVWVFGGAPAPRNAGPTS